MSVEISVIVPVYNKINDLARCVNSLINQTFDNFEIILVDDGSQDGSAGLCDLFAKEHANIKVIHKSNGGLSDARNVGMEKASGAYISFVDADDYVESGYLEYLYNMQKSYSADISCCSSLIGPAGRGRPWVPDDRSIELLSSKGALLSLLYGEKINISVWARLYRADLFNTIRFPIGKLYEDVKCSCELMAEAERIVVGTSPLYHYVMSSDSITHNVDCRIFDRFELAQEASEMVEALADEELSLAAKRYLIYHCLAVIRSKYPNDINTLAQEQKIGSILISVGKEFFLDKRVPLRDKCALVLYRMGGKRAVQMAWDLINTGSEGD